MKSSRRKVIKNFEVKVKFQGFNPHSVFHVAKIEPKTTPAAFKFVHVDLERDPNLSSLTDGKIAFYNPYCGLKYTILLDCIFSSIQLILLHSLIRTFTSTIPITPTNTNNCLPSDDPNITNNMVSHYDCEKQHTLRQFILLNVKQCTEAPSNIQHASVKARVFVRAKAKRINAYKCVAYAKKEERFVSKY